jgi:phospholipase C
MRRHVNGSLTNATNFLLPYYMNARGGDAFQATQCATGGTNAIKNNLAADNNDLNNIWPCECQRDPIASLYPRSCFYNQVVNSEFSMAYFKREDIPVQWAIADLCE